MLFPCVAVSIGQLILVESAREDLGLAEIMQSNCVFCRDHFRGGIRTWRWWNARCTRRPTHFQNGTIQSSQKRVVKGWSQNRTIEKSYCQEWAVENRFKKRPCKKPVPKIFWRQGPLLQEDRASHERQILSWPYVHKKITYVTMKLTEEESELIQCIRDNEMMSLLQRYISGLNEEDTWSEPDLQ